MLKNALVRNGALFPLPLGRGLPARLYLDFGAGLVSLVTCGVAEYLVACGAVDFVVEVDGSCLIGESDRGGGLVVRSSSSSNAALQKKTEKKSII